LTDPRNQATSLFVLGGPNGSGKTSALEACLIAAGAAENARWARGAQAIRQGAGDYKITACFESGGTMRWTEIGSSGASRIGTTPDRHYQPVNVPCVYFSSYRSPKFVGPVSLPRPHKVSSKKRVAEADRLRQIKRFLTAEKAFDAMTRDRGFVDFGDGRTYSRYEKVIERLNQAWQKFYPGSEMTFAAEPAGNEGTAGFDVYLKSAGRRLPVDSLSSGQLEVFNFAGWMLAENFEGGLVVIDEPELHLDPQWHTSILRALRALQPNAQFIVATHSPRLFDSAMEFERAFLIPADDPRADHWLPAPHGAQPQPPLLTGNSGGVTVEGGEGR
jgi:hypothetical protein